MMINVVHIEWNNINKAVPAFLTISLMPLTYSISYGAQPCLISAVLPRTPAPAGSRLPCCHSLEVCLTEQRLLMFSMRLPCSGMMTATVLAS
jgi:xanthine/uracil/vitamin C permease (AzgA family)